MIDDQPHVTGKRVPEAVLCLKFAHFGNLVAGDGLDNNVHVPLKLT